MTNDTPVPISGNTDFVEKRVEFQPILVEFKGGRYWWQKKEDGTGALAPLEHCDEDGNITFEGMFQESFAHVYNDGISRFGQKIGTKDDFKFIKPPQSPSL